MTAVTACFVGIDISKTTLDLALLTRGTVLQLGNLAPAEAEEHQDTVPDEPVMAACLDEAASMASSKPKSQPSHHHRRRAKTHRSRKRSH